MRYATLSTLLLLAATWGCSSTMPEVKPVRPADLRADNATLPMLVELQPGDRIPLDLYVGGDLMELEPGATPPTVLVKKRFFVLLQEDSPPRLSIDGKTLGQVHGSLSIGLGAKPKEGVRASVGVSTKTDGAE